MEARQSYLSAAFGAIDSEYGSFESYVHRGLGLSSLDVQQLKKTYLE